MITDNGSAFRSHAFRVACGALGIRQKFTRAYRPQTRGKAERFIQSALREWGPTGTPTSIPISVGPPRHSGITSTTGTDPITASAAKPPALGYRVTETTF